ncbi:MAG: multiheme c-type cytochrome [Planctomycetota bacterium]
MTGRAVALRAVAVGASALLVLFLLRPGVGEIVEAARPSMTLSVAVTGNDEGYLEPCGCAGGLLGGLPRRHTLLQAVKGGGEKTLLPLSNGGIVKLAGEFYDGKRHEGGPLDVVKLETFLLAMDRMGYAALNLAPNELALGRSALIPALELVEIPLLATNLVDEGEPPLPVRRWTARDTPWGRVLVLGLMALSGQQQLGAIDEALHLEDPAEAAKGALREAGEAHFVVALLRGDRRSAEQLAAAVAAIDVIFISGGSEIPESFPRGSTGNPSGAASEAPGSVPAMIATTGAKGKFIPIVTFEEREPRAKASFQMLSVSEDLPDSPDMRDYFALHLERLAAENVLAAYLEKEEVPGGLHYVGASACAECHGAESEAWERSEHFRSWATLAKVGRTADPDCVQCHVTGFGLKSGFASLEKTPSLSIVSCEECHGAGSKHVESVREEGESRFAGPHERGRSACPACHDMDHSPAFNFEKYWQKIAHGKE